MKRVGVFVNVEFSPTGELKLHYLGRGVIEGVFAFGDEDSQISADTCESRINLFIKNGEYPEERIRLDSGTVVWSSTVFYEDEQEFDDFLKKVDVIVNVDLQEHAEFSSLERSLHNALSQEIFNLEAGEEDAEEEDPSKLN